MCGFGEIGGKDRRLEESGEVGGVKLEKYLGMVL